MLRLIWRCENIFLKGKGMQDIFAVYPWTRERVLFNILNAWLRKPRVRNWKMANSFRKLSAFSFRREKIMGHNFPLIAIILPLNPHNTLNSVTHSNARWTWKECFGYDFVTSSSMWSFQVKLELKVSPSNLACCSNSIGTTLIHALGNGGRWGLKQMVSSLVLSQFKWNK